MSPQLPWNVPETPLILLGWILVTLLCHSVFVRYNPLRSWIPSSCHLYLLGLLFGILCNVCLDWNLYLFPALFFIYLLPPVALDAGYFMPKNSFFNNIGTIVLYAIVGTMLSTVIIGSVLYLSRPLFNNQIDVISILLFATLVSPTDPVSVLSVFDELNVNDQLFILVSGESLFNDAFGIVLYHSLSSLAVTGAENVVTFDVLLSLGSFFVVGSGSIIFGVIWGAVTAIGTKIISYGLFIHRYVEKNLDDKVLSALNTATKSCSDAIIFSFLGISTISLHHIWDWMFIIITLMAMILATFLLTFLANQGRTERIGWKTQVVLAFSGIRGPICYSLVQSLDSQYVPAKAMLVTTSIVIIVITLLIQGVIVKPFLNALSIERAKRDEENVLELRTDLTIGIEAIAGIKETNRWQQRCLSFIEKYVDDYLMRRTGETVSKKYIYSVMPLSNLTHGSPNQQPLE